MPCNAEFGIIDHIDPQREEYDYEPERYHCVSVDDDYLNDWWPELDDLPTYFHNLSRPETALARYGITLIPPGSLTRFYEIVQRDPCFASRPELPALLQLIDKAIQERKWMIHFGV